MNWQRESDGVFVSGEFRIELIRPLDRDLKDHWLLTNESQKYWFTHPTYRSAQEAALRLKEAA